MCASVLAFNSAIDYYGHKFDSRKVGWMMMRNGLLLAFSVALSVLGMTLVYGADAPKPAAAPAAAAAPAEKAPTIEDLYFAKGQLIERARSLKETAERGMTEIKDRTERALAEIKTEIDNFDAQIAKLKEPAKK